MCLCLGVCVLVLLEMSLSTDRCNGDVGQCAVFVCNVHILSIYFSVVGEMQSKFLVHV